MKTVKLFGVNLVHGCDLPGGEHAMDVLSQYIHFDHRFEVDASKLKEQKPLYLDAIVDINLRLKTSIQNAMNPSIFPLVIGGDHALAIGSIAAHASEDLAVLWMDAHGDCNTDLSSITQRIHGMPLATLMGYGHHDLTSLVDVKIKAENVCLFGIRDLDEEEERLMRTWGVKIITMHEIREMGIDSLLTQLKNFIDKCPKFHLSYDNDSMDTEFIKGVNTPVPGGFTQEEANQVLNFLIQQTSLNSMDIVEFNPVKDDGATQAWVLKWVQTIKTIKEV